MDDSKIAKVSEFIAKRLRDRPTRFIGEPKQANPVYVMYRIEDLLVELESLARQDTFVEAADALSRGCTYLDYDSTNGWTK